MLTEPRRVVAGHRLEELIGIGERANVYRATSLSSSSSSLSSSSTSGGRSRVVVKICSGGPSARERDAECRILAERPIAAMPRLLDVATTPERELVIVMSLCRGRTLRSLHSRGPSVQSIPSGRSPAAARGSSFTALVAELHAAGVAHGSLDADAVLIDESGALVLVGFRSARRTGEPGFEVALAADQRAVRRLSAAVEAVGTPGFRDQVDMRDAVNTPGFRDTFDVHDPGGSPADRDDNMTGSTSMARDRVRAIDSATGRHHDPWDWQHDSEPETSPPEPALVEVLEPAALAVRESWLALRSLFRSRSVRALAPGRRRVLVAGGALLLAAVVVACVLLPTSGPSRSSADTSVSSPRAASSVPSSSVPSPAASTAAAASSAALASPADADSDDPMVAVTVLLERRRACLARHDPGCLDQVDQWGSPALMADRELARPTGSDGPVSPDPIATITEVSLVQRLGAAAVLRGVASQDEGSPTKKPVSLLVMRNETGWRIRWYDSG